jgi:hypothetical protein
MKSNNFFEKQICNVCCITGFLTWNEMCHFRKSIDYHEYGITTSLCPRQSQHKIHAYCIPRPLWYWQWLIQPCILSFPLCVLENSTSVDKFLDICPHSWPIIQVVQLRKCFIMAEMSSQSPTMFFLQKVFSHRTLWDTQLISFE